MTTVYFIRHAQPDYSIHENDLRPLTDKGLNDSKRVTEFLKNKKIDVIYSSPYKRAVDTIKNFADTYDYKINILDDFRERKIDSYWIKNFESFSKKQWYDFNYKRAGGESLKEVQKRNITALSDVLKKNADKKIVVATHSTALCTIINYYDKRFNFKDFKRIKKKMPYIIKFVFNGLICVKFEEIKF